MYCEPNDSTMPYTRPPTSAPSTLPKPPKTQTTNALMMNGSPIAGLRLNDSLISDPAAPASPAPNPWTTAYTWATRTPESCAAPTSIDVARIARPIFECVSHQCISAVIASAHASFAHGTVTGPIEKFAPAYDGVTARASPVQTTSARLTSKSERPKVKRNVVRTGARTT